MKFKKKVLLEDLTITYTIVKQATGHMYRIQWGKINVSAARYTVSQVSLVLYDETRCKENV